MFTESSTVKALGGAAKLLGVAITPMTSGIIAGVAVSLYLISQIEAQIEQSFQSKNTATTDNPAQPE